FCDQRVNPAYAGRRFDHLVLETSGLADPGPIVDAISADPVLQHHIVVRELVVAVDALHGLVYLKNEPLGRRQAGTADRLVITKVDAAEPGQLARLAATLARLKPTAGIEASAMGSPATLPDFADVAPEELP